MLIQDKKHFTWGAVLAVSFFAVLSYMFTPNFGGQNAFHASDALFNSIAKDSTYYLPKIMEQAKAFDGEMIAVTVLGEETDLAAEAALILERNGVTLVPVAAGVSYQADLGKLLAAALADSDAMFYNKGEELEAKYGIEAKRAMFLWWKVLTGTITELNLQKKFKPALFLQTAIAKGVEVGYNFYGIQPESAASKAGTLAFALVFYVIYTLWWGFAIFFLSEGLGLQMKKGKRAET
ncbi:MAG: hypothetical protein AB7E32_02620 [Desulfovibrio sp.]